MKPIKRFDYCKFTIEQEKNIKEEKDMNSSASKSKSKAKTRVSEDQRLTHYQIIKAIGTHADGFLYGK